MFSQSFNQWVSTVAHVCRKKLKVRLNISVIFLCFLTDLVWGGGQERAANGGVSGDLPSGFCACFGRTTSDPSRGRVGGGRALTPSLQAAITAESAHHAPQHINFSLKSSSGHGFPATPPPHVRQPSPAHVFLPRDIKVFI